MRSVRISLFRCAIVLGLTASLTACSPSGAHDDLKATSSTPGGQTTVPAPASAATFVGDFETGDFSQWVWCQNAAVNSIACSDMRPMYNMVVETNVVRQGKYAARFEVHQGDRPFCCGDRAELSGDAKTEAAEGDDRWYQWSTMFGTNFPADVGYSVVSQWHSDTDGSPPVQVSAGPINVDVNRWGVVITTYTARGVPGPTYTPWSAPVVRGVWNDMKFHIKWSADDRIGFVEFWLNGKPQTFTAEPCAGQTRCRVRTMMPDGGGIYFKQGYYRHYDIVPPGVVYQDGFSQANSEADLNPL